MIKFWLWWYFMPLRAIKRLVVGEMSGLEKLSWLIVILLIVGVLMTMKY